MVGERGPRGRRESDLTECFKQVHAVRGVVGMSRARWLPGACAFVVLLLLSGFSASAQWQQINEDGFGVPCDTTTELVAFNDNLYAGTRFPGRLFRLGDLSEESWFHWTEIDLPAEEYISDPLRPTETTTVSSMAVFTPSGGGFPWLYVAVTWGDESFLLRSQNTVVWSLGSEVWDCGEDGEALELAVFEGRLYVAVGDTRGSDVEKMRIHRTADGTDWVTVPPEAFDFGPGDHWIEDLEVFGEYLYAGASGHNESAPGDHVVEVWRSRDGMDWSRIGELTSPTVSEVESMEAFGGYLYVGTKNHYGIEEETTVPELWRFDGREWEKIETAGRFRQNALHVDSLRGHDGVLYAGIGGGPGAEHAYGRIYRSVDGETWEQITPAGISGHPENSYLLGAILGIGEYVYIATGGGEAGTGGTQVWRMATLRSNVGPCLARHDGEPYLLHRLPYPNENIWETVLREDELVVLGAVHDQNAARSWAFTGRQPVAYGYDHTGLLLRNRYLQLVYRGHNNSRIWYTRKSCLDGRNWYWETPASVPDSRTDRAPGATAHDWSGPAGPQLTVAYTDAETGRIHFRVKEGTHWSSEYTLPEAARTSNGPEIVSFRDSLYAFYRGHGDDDWLYVARKASNRASDARWEISQLPRAFTRPSETDRAVSAVVYDGALVVAYVGHNNDYIWLRRSTDGVHWDRLGYVRGPVSDHNPDLAVVGETLYLAFKPTGDSEVCFGTLELDAENEHDTPGHVWRSLRPMRCCPNCIMTILDVVIPLRPPSDDD